VADLTRPELLAPPRLLAELTAARRPTVSLALPDMARRGVVLQVDGGWSLVGPPPSDLVELSPVASLPPPAPRPEAKPRVEAKPRPETQPMPRPAAPASPTPASSPPSAS
jgi:hypothetical protein